MHLETLYDYLKLTVPNTFNVVRNGSGIEVGVKAGTLYGSMCSDYFWIDDNLIKFNTISDGVPDYIPKIFGGVTPQLIPNINTWRKVYSIGIPKDLQ